MRFVVDASNGSIAQVIDYDEFGQVISNSNPGFQPFGFAGGLVDDDTRLVHFGAREYDPYVGRWIQPDPSLFRGKDTNLYSYAFNDPVNFADVTGRDPTPCQQLEQDILRISRRLQSSIDNYRETLYAPDDHATKITQLQTAIRNRLRKWYNRNCKDDDDDDFQNGLPEMQDMLNFVPYPKPDGPPNFKLQLPQLPTLTPAQAAGLSIPGLILMVLLAPVGM